jgi:hypothetical protein
MGVASRADRLFGHMPRYSCRGIHLDLLLRVLIDGQPPASAHGVDVDEQGYGTVAEPRMYQLIRQPSPIADREFEIEFLGSDVQVFDFTFG